MVALGVLSPIRSEIQALRAVAVTLVVAFHLWPEAVPGGFIGVDVFFVISGFLITALLLREIERTKSVSLTRFWARRARRILPAALFTLLACAVATTAFVPINLWPQFFAELRASTLYVQNWHLAATAVDYFAVAEHSRSPVQHFWSLAVEEQFYLLWPVLLLAVATRRWALLTAMSAVTALSFGYSLAETSTNPLGAYFVTPTRAWEFGVGGLLAFAGVRARPSPFLSWLGLAAITAGAFAFSVETPFPGWAAAVPVLGTLAVIHARAPGRVLALRPLQFLGDISYSAYLWHWPLIVFAPYILGHEIHTETRIGILVLTVLIAWMSTRLIEDPVRASSSLTRRRPGWTFGLAGVGMIALLLPIASATGYVDQQRRADHERTAEVLASSPKCFGAAAMDPLAPCENPRLRLTVVPTPIEARAMAMGQCRELRPMLGKRVCAFGAAKADAIDHVALVGDSHAGMWRVALDQIGLKRRWSGVHMGHASCPLSAAVRDIPEPSRSSCTRWRKLVFAWFAKHPEVSTLFVAQLSGGSGVVAGRSRSQAEAQISGYQRAWRALPPTVKRVVVIRDTPKVERDTAACVQRAIARDRAAGRACSVRRSGAIERDMAAVAAARMRSAGVTAIDLNRFFCDGHRCYPVIGGALVYKDTTHVLEPFMRSLTPYVERELDGAGLTAPQASAG